MSDKIRPPEKTHVRKASPDTADGLANSPNKRQEQLAHRRRVWLATRPDTQNCKRSVVGLAISRSKSRVNESRSAVILLESGLQTTLKNRAKSSLISQNKGP